MKPDITRFFKLPVLMGVQKREWQVRFVIDALPEPT